MAYLASVKVMILCFVFVVTCTTLLWLTACDYDPNITVTGYF